MKYLKCLFHNGRILEMCYNNIHIVEIEFAHW